MQMVESETERLAPHYSILTSPTRARRIFCKAVATIVVMRIAIDTGGTFTDCVYLRDGQLHVLKVFSTPADPSQAVLNAVREILAAEENRNRAVEVRHGTTVGTNALLERKGARVAFITTSGLEDTIAIG